MNVVLINYESIKVDCGIEIETIQEIRIEEEINNHSTGFVKGIINDNFTHTDLSKIDAQSDVKIYIDDEEKQTLFHGNVSKLNVENINGMYYITLELISYSKKLDYEVKSRSFQDKDNTYSELCKQIVEVCVD